MTFKLLIIWVNDQRTGSKRSLNKGSLPGVICWEALSQNKQITPLSFRFPLPSFVSLSSPHLGSSPENLDFTFHLVSRVPDLSQSRPYFCYTDGRLWRPITPYLPFEHSRKLTAGRDSTLLYGTSYGNVTGALSNLLANPHLKLNYSSAWCGSVDWALACETKGHWFTSQSGHMPGLQA